MNKKIIILLLAVVLLSIGLAYYYLLIRSVSPCPFTDTVDLTGYEKFPNGSYSYEGLIIPPKLLGVYKYTLDHLSNRVPVKPHVRGCVCSPSKPCVKFCCPITTKMVQDKCIDPPGNLTLSHEMNITTNSGELMKVDLTKTFSIQIGSSCVHKYYLEPHHYPDDVYSLFENGTLLVSKQYYLSKDQYCLSYYKFKRYAYLVPSPMNCSHHQPLDETRAHVTAITMLISVPFFICTIFVYMAITELRTLHGKSLCCHLSGLSFAYLILGVIILIPSENFSETSCKILGFSGYFSFMTGFSWLSVISFDLYSNIRAPRGSYNEKKRFIFYSIYAWGLALILLCLTYIADSTEIIPQVWRPLIKINTRCWFNGVSGWTAMIYLYIPMLSILFFCIVMFILTSILIHRVQNEMKQMIERNDSQKNFRTERNRFAILFRLFTIMGLPWILDIIPYLVGPKSSWITLHYILDFIIGGQGILIFALFVFKKKVKKYITKRFLPIINTEPQSQDSNKTQASSTISAFNEFGSYKLKLQEK